MAYFLDQYELTWNAFPYLEEVWEVGNRRKRHSGSHEGPAYVYAYMSKSL